jgi:threonylcarbamoyladenosine tRNA methylthiotransferase MtaB
MLHILSDKKKVQFYQQNNGKQHEVLFESEHHKGFIYGFTDNYIRVKTLYNPKLINHIIPVRLSEMDNDSVYIAELMNG